MVPSITLSFFWFVVRNLMMSNLKMSWNIKKAVIDLLAILKTIVDRTIFH